MVIEEKNSKSPIFVSKNLPFDEEVILDYCDADFDTQIKQRGEDYYFDDYVDYVFKCDNHYYAEVRNSQGNIYNVSIDISNRGITYECDCPCSYPCKHEYAVLVAISNQEYTIKQLKKHINEKTEDLKSIIEIIPAQELKEFFLTTNDIDSIIKNTQFGKFFKKYYPSQSYEFYYNNLYNELILERNYEELTNKYIRNIKQYIDASEFREVVKIIKALINAYNDTNNLNYTSYIIDLIPKLAMFLRVTYRQANEEVIKEIELWKHELAAVSYYKNYYLEDMFLSIRKNQYE